MRHDVLIAGAGPTGLVLALWLTRLGVSVRVLDKAQGPGTTSRALAVQARTLELYRQLDLTDAVLSEGHTIAAVNLWVEGDRKAQIAFGAIGADLTPYPFLHIYPQDRHEQLLVERLAAAGIEVERRTELVDFTDHGDHISARFQRADGETGACEARYIVGCDGARSTVRKGMGADFPGGSYRQLFYVADIEGDGPALNGELHLDLDQADFIAVFPLAPARRARLVGIIRDERAEHAEDLRFEDVSDRAMRDLKIRVDKVNWFSTYHVHHRVADRFRSGRAFLAGDAGHIHSPAGGQGMNTGIGDAINLAWKLAAVLKGEADDRLLESYEAERIQFARRLVQTTDRAFTAVTAEGPMAQFLRSRVAPLVMPLATGLAAVRTFMFRTVSQTTITYRDGPLGQGRAGRVRGGDRLPWAVIDGIDNFASLSAMGWQAHVYGPAGDALKLWCAARGLPLHQFAWADGYRRAGLMRGAIYLLRPDSYVALADPSGDPAALQAYLDRHGLKPIGFA
jgi:2-polyprenyl-6-methoxyphenol hydroxylase-like FAD-dependent oxidoreductase